MCLSDVLEKTRMEEFQTEYFLPTALLPCPIKTDLIMLVLILKAFQLYPVIILTIWSKFLFIHHHFFPCKIFYGVVFNTWVEITLTVSVQHCNFFLYTLQLIPSLLIPWEIWHTTHIPNKNIFKNSSQPIPVLLKSRSCPYSDFLF